jgi:hypothetical protein
VGDRGGVGGTEYGAEKAHVGVGQLSSHCGETQALHCLGETESKLKLRVSPREKLISNPQSRSVSGRGLVAAHLPTPHWTTSENPPTPEVPLH